jgi:hypothetical protein
VAMVQTRRSSLPILFTSCAASEKIQPNDHDVIVPIVFLLESYTYGRYR